MEQKNSKKFLILDGHSLAYRAFYALPLELQTKKGLHTNAVLGFTNMLLRLIADQSPAYILTAFDYPAPTFRHQAFHAYKATREKTPPEFQEQLPQIKAVLKALKVAVRELEGYEADDLLGAFARQGEKAGLATYIVTADADAYQLLSPKVKILITRQGITRLEELTVETFRESYGLSPRQWVDFKALKGDSSDNIPGVPGIGEKRALQLLKKYGSLEEVLANALDIPGKMGENLSAYAEQALLSKELATICVDIPLDLSLSDCSLKEPEWEDLLQIFSRLELKSLAKKITNLAYNYQKTVTGGNRDLVTLDGAGEQAIAGGADDPVTVNGAGGSAVSGSAGVAGPTGGRSDSVHITDPDAAAEPFQFSLAGKNKEKDLQQGTCSPLSGVSDRAGDAKSDLQEGMIINKIAELQQLTELCRRQGSAQPFVLLLNTDPAPTHAAVKIKGLSCALTEKDVFYITLENYGGAVTLSAVFAALQPLLENPEGMLITHDLKPLLKELVTGGFKLSCSAFDTLLAAYLLQPERPAYHLSVLFEEYLGLLLPTVDKGLPAEEATRQKALQFILSARCLFDLKDIFLANLENRQQKDLFFRLEMPLASVLAKMELRGIKVDAGVWEKLALEMEKNMAGLETEVMALAGEEFNLNSPQQLSYILFEKLGLPVIRRTKTGYSTDVRVLQELSALHPLVAKVMEYRTVAKLKGTYLQGMHSLIDPRTGKIHTTFNQAVTATGRLSSKDPNLQNIPIRLAEGRRLRQAFIPSHPDNLLLAADYSQIELRIMAHLSQDPGLMDAFQKNEDVHRRTAAEVFNVPPAEVTPLMRERAKAVNFGIIYGISDYGLAQGLQIPRAEARQYIKSYFNRYPGVNKYAAECIRQAREKGYVTTLLKRRRYLPEINHPHFSRRSVAERAARNTPIQGSAADLIKAAMLAIEEELENKGLAAAMLLQVHDELIFELPRAELPLVAASVKGLMENIFPLLIPVRVELKTGPNWYHLEPLEL